MSLDKAQSFVLDKGITVETLREFGVAYQDPQGKLIGSTFPEALKGLLTSKFNDCILIPMHDCYGVPQSVIARQLEKKPKYLYVSQFKAHDHLFGLDKTISHLVSTNTAVLVEGPFDVIACYQYGIKNAVGLLGTALTNTQLGLLMRYTNKWIVVLDNDNAGQEGVKKIKGIGKQNGIKVQVLTLPANQDLDELLKQEGFAAWEALCAKQVKNISNGLSTRTGLLTTGTSSILAKPV